jgi:hypothetical protein
MPARRRLALVIALAFAGAVMAACRPAARPELPPPPLDPSRFPHPKHAELGCAECHDVRAAIAGELAPPGADDHAPCDRAQCHQVDFTRPPGPLCKVCHEAVDPSGVKPSPRKPYPPADAWRAAPARFSHAKHLDRGAMEQAVGFHVGCDDCHASTADAAYPATAGHAECARCHAAEVGLVRAPSMGDCARCHGGGVAERHPRRVIRNDLLFDHRRHHTDMSGARIACETCHDQTSLATSTADHVPPPIAACVACHDDGARVPATLRMRICESCHTERSEAFGTLAPRSHLPATELPIDHTLAFRSDHGDAAAADAARCARCHTQLSGSRNAACDECHQTMRPRDHTALWRELDHGAEAGADTTRCATCHVAQFCTACHAQVPRSHLPREAFVLDHGPQALINVRSCLTCHDPAESCVRCHPGEPPVNR